MATKNIIDESEYQTIISEPELTVVDFGASWCKPCLAIKPFVKKLATEYEEKCNFVLIDIDEAPEIAELEQISSVPTFIFYKDGKKLERFSGADEELLLKVIQQHK